jgi:hypothetical protein
MSQIFFTCPKLHLGYVTSDKIEYSIGKGFKDLGYVPNSFRHIPKVLKYQRKIEPYTIRGIWVGDPSTIQGIWPSTIHGICNIILIYRY